VPLNVPLLKVPISLSFLFFRAQGHIERFPLFPIENKAFKKMKYFQKNPKIICPSAPKRKNLNVYKAFRRGTLQGQR